MCKFLSTRCCSLIVFLHDVVKKKKKTEEFMFFNLFLFFWEFIVCFVFQMTEDGVSISCLSLEGHLGKLEIMGSKAVQILQKILHPVFEWAPFSHCNLGGILINKTKLRSGTLFVLLPGCPIFLRILCWGNVLLWRITSYPNLQRLPSLNMQNAFLLIRFSL